MTVALVAVPVAVAVNPPGDEVTLYPVIGDPPLEAGAVQVTVAWALPAVAVTAVGAPGGPMGMTVFFNDTATTEISALSLHDALPFSVPLVRPLTVALVAVPLALA